MKRKEEMIKNLSEAKLKALLAHFNTIYECPELREDEFKIIYLAWLWKSGIVYQLDNGFSTFEEKEAGVSLSDYEITIEAEEGGGINLDLIYIYYELNKIMEIV